MTGRLAGKVAFITGAARGQGRAHAVRMADEGADIIAVDIAGKLPPCVPYRPGDSRGSRRNRPTGRGHGRRILAAVVDTRDHDGLSKAVDDGVANWAGSTSSSPTPASPPRRPGTRSRPRSFATSWTST